MISTVFIVILIIALLSIVFWLWMFIDMLGSKIPAWGKIILFFFFFWVPIMPFIWFFVRDTSKKRMKRVRSKKKKRGKK